jgi:hypothetical protein
MKFYVSSRHCGGMLGFLAVQRFHGSPARLRGVAMVQFLAFVVLPQFLAFDNFLAYSLFLYLAHPFYGHAHIFWVLPPKLFV